MTSSKTLSKGDLTPVLQEMEKHLMSKNVAKDIAEKLCESVGNALVGKKLGGFGSECWPTGDILTSVTKSLPGFLALRGPLPKASNPKSIRRYPPRSPVS